MKGRLCVNGDPGVPGCFGSDTEDEVCNLEVFSMRSDFFWPVFLYNICVVCRSAQNGDSGPRGRTAACLATAVLYVELGDA